MNAETVVANARAHIAQRGRENEEEYRKLMGWYVIGSY